MSINPQLPSLDSIGQLQLALKNAIASFKEANPDVNQAYLAPTVVGSFLAHPWLWIVEVAGHAPETFVQYMMQEVTLFKDAATQNPTSVMPDNLS